MLNIHPPQGPAPFFRTRRPISIYKVLTEELCFDYIIRFRGNIAVTAATGETRTAAAWVRPGGRARVLRGAMVTADRYKVGTVICVQDPEMKQAWCLAASSITATSKELTGYYGRRRGGLPGAEAMPSSDVCRRRQPTSTRSGGAFVRLFRLCAGNHGREAAEQDQPDNDRDDDLVSAPDHRHGHRFGAAPRSAACSICISDAQGGFADAVLSFPNILRSR